MNIKFVFIRNQTKPNLQVDLPSIVLHRAFVPVSSFLLDRRSEETNAISVAPNHVGAAAGGCIRVSLSVIGLGKQLVTISVYTVIQFGTKCQNQFVVG